MTPPEPRSNTARERRRSGWIATVFVGMLLLGGGVLLCLLPIGKLGPAIVIGGGLFTLMVGLHYLVWGYWITRLVESDREQSRDDL